MAGNLVRRPQPWQVWLVCGAFTIAGYYLIPHPGPERSFLYAGLSAASALSMLAGIRHHRPVRVSVWYWLAAATGVWAVGDLLFAEFFYVRGDTTFPSWADVFYLGGVPAFAAGGYVLIKGRVSRRDRAGLLDALVISAGLALLTWTFLMRPIAADASGTPLARIVSLALPAGDLLLICMLLRLGTSPGARSASYRFLLAAFGLSLGTDILYSIVRTVSHYEGGAMDAGWMAANVCLGAAALHPSMRTLSEVAPDRAERFPRRRIGVLAAMTLLAPGVLVFQSLTDPRDVDWPAISIGSLVMLLLVTARMSGLVAQVRDQAARLDAVADHDGLTGLPNRRVWDVELNREMSKARRSGTHICVALLDLDHFKRFNDAQGHRAGDRLLKEATAAWRTMLRPGDMLARYGGAQFGVVLVGAEPEEARLILDRLRAGTPGGQTLSAGLVRWNGVESADEVVGRADAALYHAKRAGRDRVHLDDPVAGAPGIRLPV